MCRCTGTGGRTQGPRKTSETRIVQNDTWPLFFFFVKLSFRPVHAQHLLPRILFFLFSSQLCFRFISCYYNSCNVSSCSPSLCWVTVLLRIFFILLSVFFIQFMILSPLLCLLPLTLSNFLIDLPLTGNILVSLLTTSRWGSSMTTACDGVKKRWGTGYPRHVPVTSEGTPLPFPHSSFFFFFYGWRD